MNAPLLSIKGTGCVLHIHRDKLVLEPKGLSGMYFRGLKGAKSIPYASITAVQHKEPGILQGYLQFTLPGGRESGGGWRAACFDENSFLYYGNHELVLKAVAYIERRMAELRAGAQAPEPSTSSAAPLANASRHEAPSLAEELNKLAALRAAGALTEAEFTSAKAKVMS